MTCDTRPFARGSRMKLECQATTPCHVTCDTRPFARGSRMKLECQGTTLGVFPRRVPQADRVSGAAKQKGLHKVATSIDTYIMYIRINTRCVLIIRVASITSRPQISCIRYACVFIPISSTSLVLNTFCAQFSKIYPHKNNVHTCKQEYIAIRVSNSHMTCARSA